MRNIIIGSGPAAAAAVLALESDGSEQITVLDIGAKLDARTQEAIGRMSASAPGDWLDADLAMIQKQPVKGGTMLPEKRSFGSRYMFDNRGQQRGILTSADGNDAAVSGALGGFSNVWGAQIMPFSASTFRNWPFSWQDIEPHYQAVLREVPLAAQLDDYAERFPLLAEAAPLPPLARRTSAVLDRYSRHRDAIRRSGVIVGAARLAFESKPCVRCGLCMTGCPYDLIYSARHTINKFIAKGRIDYLGDVLVLGVDERPGQRPTVRGVDLTTDRMINFEADRVFVAAGGLGSTRILLNSLPNPPQRLELAESMQFLVPFLSRGSVGDPRGQDPEFTLNQFNMLLEFDDDAYTTSQIHCYPHNPAIVGALPSVLRRRAMNGVSGAVLGRVTAGLGYLPSWESPRLTVDLLWCPEGRLPVIEVKRASEEAPRMLKSVIKRLMTIGPKLDLTPVPQLLRSAGPAKSYHFGGTFPHTRSGQQGTDPLGRPAGWSNIHLIDASVLPTVPSTTFTLSVMANAHRIVSGSRRG